MKKCEHCGKTTDGGRFCNPECIRLHKRMKAGIGVMCGLADKMEIKERDFE